jgi:maltose alpha-D-glucosyltransferase/alpha-amylase
LRQVLYTGKDFLIIDFEGEPARTMRERRLKRSPLRDVAGMIRSFHYAAQTALRHQRTLPPGDAALLEPWLEFWTLQIGARFLSAYRTRLGDMPFIPREEELLEDLLRAFLLEKAVYELGYELNNRPGWATIPLKGIDMMLKT